VKTTLNIAQIVLSIIIIGLILLTTKEGWSGSGLAAPVEKRGLEKILFFLTIFFIVTFVILSLAQLYFFGH